MENVLQWFSILGGVLVDEWAAVAGMGALLAVSAVFSASETALFSLSPDDLSRLRSAGGFASPAVTRITRRTACAAPGGGRTPFGVKSALILHGELQRLLLSLLFGNLAVNTAFFALAGSLGVEAGAAGLRGGEVAVGAGALLLIVLFGEVIPKNVAIVLRVAVVRTTSAPLLAWHRVAEKPLAKLGALTRFGERLAGVKSGGGGPKREEIRMLVDFSRTDGVITGVEHALIDGVLDFPAVRMREIMTHRVDVASVDADLPVAVAVTTALEAGRTRLPVRNVERDEWIGWIDARMLALENATGRADQWLRPPVYLSDLDRADQALAKLRQAGTAMGFVVDERGVIEGVVTFSDLLAELFGALGDEEVDANNAFREEDGGYVMPGTASVRDWKAYFDTTADDDWPDCATLGGLVTYLLGRSPRAGESVDWRGMRMTVRTMHGRRPREIWLGATPSDAPPPSPEIHGRPPAC